MNNKMLLINLLWFPFLISCTNMENGKENGNTSSASGMALMERLKDMDIMASSFLYHRFSENKYPSTSISSALFEQQLKYLKDHRIPVITLGELLQWPDSASQNQKYVILTIDDAFDSFHQHGFPLLKKYGFKATLFVNTATIGSGDYSGWEELREIYEYGIELGNHTHSHAYFLNEPPGQRLEYFKHEVAQAQDIFREKLGIECRVFAYPFGEYDTGMQKIISELGFFGAAAQNSGVISGYTDPFALPRFPMTDQYGQMDSFIEKVNMLALPVVEMLPLNTISENNPPVLKIRFIDPGLDLDRLQCFVQGGVCKIALVIGDTISAEITAQGKLTGRRHLYTITVPHKTTGRWYWFSQQWVFPEKP
ncbi:MAG: polysaccharide deacetylase family protein [Cyclobacteriaceae bacterium]|nr:polysaccharide deacetylase family protein [Cyclobacteriaceae bacterium]